MGTAIFAGQTANRLRLVGFDGSHTNAIEAVQGQMPLSRVGGFEWVLGRGSNALDFLICYRTGDSAMAEAVAARRFSADWEWLAAGIETYSAIAPQRSPFWLEFDLSRQADCPGFFVACPRGCDPLAIAGPVATAMGLSRTVHQLETITAAIPGSATLFQLGWMPHRNPDSIRLCIDGLTTETLPALLRALPWNGSSETVATQIAPLSCHVDHLGLGLDVCEGRVQERIGVEYTFAGSRSRIPRRRWRQLLQAALAAGLCTPVEQERLLAWMGTDSGQNDETLFSPQGSMILNPSLKMSLEYGLHHLKTIHQATAVVAKAYFGYALYLKPVTLP